MQQQQQQWINSALPGARRTTTEQQGVSSAPHHRTAQNTILMMGGGGPQRTPHHHLRGSGVRGSRGPGGWVFAWSWMLLGSLLLLPGAWSFLSEEQEELIVELHNHYRGMVSPSASAMLPLKWDPSLKVIAEGYAAKCVWNHNPDLEETGENLFANTGPLDLREALEKWFYENLAFDYHNNSCPEDKMCGHYTQMVWADTHRVGCAWHLCNTMDGLDFERANFLVCNYYPAGNYDDQKPYVEGDWCSSCPENLQNCENNLCVADTVEDEEGDEGDDDEGDSVTDDGMATPLPATSPPAAPEASSEPTPQPPALGTQSPTSPYPPPGGNTVEPEEGQEEEVTGNELDQIEDHKKGEREGESEKKRERDGESEKKRERDGESEKTRERETNREKDLIIRVSDSADSSLRSTVFQLVLVFLTVGLIVRE